MATKKGTQNRKLENERRLRLREAYWEYVKHIQCNDCGLEFDGRVGLIEFHHVVQSKENIPILRAAMCGLTTLCREVNKGVFLCPTCHRIRHLDKDGKRDNAQID